MRYMSVIVSEQKFIEKEIKDFVDHLKALGAKLTEEKRSSEKYLLEFLILARNPFLRTKKN